MHYRIHSFGKDLLGSVLKRLLASWRLTRRLNGELIFYWPEETDLRRGFRFGDLFDESVPFTLSPEYPKLSELTGLETVLDGNRIDPAKLPSEFNYNTTGIRLLHGEIMARAEEETRHLFASLAIRPEILEAVEEIDRAVPLSEAMAVHIRRGSDIVPDLRGGRLRPSTQVGHMRGYARMFVDLESYRRAVEALGSPNVFIFCGEDEDRGRFRDMIGGYTVDGFPAIRRLSPLQRDLAEILVMSRTKRLLGPISNYSGLARLLGNLPLVQVGQWIVPQTFLEMVRRDFAGELDIQEQILKFASEWYRRYSEDASRMLATAADELALQRI